MRKIMHYIYIIQNNKNLKIYVGQTINLRQRWSAHKSYAKSNKPNQYIHIAMKKYGIENFSHQLLEEYNSQNEADSAEEFWIEFFQSRNRLMGYNIKPGGMVSTLSKDTKQKISKAHKGKKLSKAHIENISKALTGRKFTEEHKNKISRLGSTQTTETREKISQAHIGMVHTKETKDKISKINSGKNSGERGPNSKLTNEQVIQIRLQASLGIKQKTLALQFNVSEKLISNIILRRTWKHI